ncbi:unnamed protein product [Prunus armeniaca]
MGKGEVQWGLGRGSKRGREKGGVGCDGKGLGVRSKDGMGEKREVEKVRKRERERGRGISL